jgi:hypothetical protein
MAWLAFGVAVKAMQFAIKFNVSRWPDARPLHRGGKLHLWRVKLRLGWRRPRPI